MGRLVRLFGFIALSFPLAAGQAGRPFNNIYSGPGLPPTDGVHTPFVGNQNWGAAPGHNAGYVHGPLHGGGERGEHGGDRRHRYPGVFAFPFFPVTDWGGYLGDANPYYSNDQGPVPDGYGPNPYLNAPVAQQPYAPSQPYPAQQAPEPAVPPEPANALQDQPEPMPPVVLVLRNGTTMQLANYAVVNDMLWDFSKPVARKIPVSSIDLIASAKATEDSGGEFPQIASSDSH